MEDELLEKIRYDPEFVLIIEVRDFQEKIESKPSVRKWRIILEKMSWDYIVNTSNPREEMEESKEEFKNFLEDFKSEFNLDYTPVKEDIIREHFYNHFSRLDHLVRDEKIKPSYAIKTGKIIYLYDIILPSLGKWVINPKFEGESAELLIVPSELYDWFSVSDFYWSKLLLKGELDFELLDSLYGNIDEIIEEAKELKIYGLIPPERDVGEIKGSEIRGKWFRNEKVEPIELHEFLYCSFAK